MIEIRYLQAESGANKFGTCNCCGKSSSEDPLMISVKFNYCGHGTTICLCDDCKKKLMEALLPANNSEIPNSSDTISRQAAIDAIYGITAYKGTIPLGSAIFNINKIPAAQHEPKRGKWESQSGGGYCCSECGLYAMDKEADGRIVMISVKSRFCPNCGAKMEVTE